jgi:hypothetical protein
MNLRFGPWQMLEAGGGNRLAIAGDLIAAADATTLVVWRAGREIARHVAARRVAGWPRIAGERVCWGDGAFDLRLGAWASAAGVDPLFEPPSPQGVETATLWAWSADGGTLGCCLAGGRDDAAARFVLLDAASGEAHTPWRSADAAPQAAWIGRVEVVLGSRRPQRLARDGTALGTLGTGSAAALPAIRLDAGADESRLLGVLPGALLLWELPHAAPRFACAGDWIDGVLAPDGEVLFALDAAGRLHTGRVRGGGILRPVTDAPPGIGALACDRGQLLVAAGARQRWHCAAYEVGP